jgi:hypothetical protein
LSASNFTPIEDQLTRIEGSLATKNLDLQQFLPPLIALQGYDVKTANYQSFLQQQSKATDKLESVVSQGLERLAAAVSGNAALFTHAATPTLLAAINRIATDASLDSNTSQAELARAFDAWRQAITGAAQPLAAPSIVRENPASLLVEIRHIAIASWIVWGLLTILVGYIILVASSPGFGGFLDFARCLLWGFGIPVAGQSLQQLSGATLNTQLGISLTRT